MPPPGPRRLDSFPGFEKVDLAEADTALKRLLPDSSILSPDRIYEAAKRRGISVKYVEVPGLHSMSQAEAFDAVFSARKLPSSRLYFVPDGALPGALTTTSREIRRLITNSHCFAFDHDAVFVWPEAGMISVIHHEGGYFHIAMGSTAAPPPEDLNVKTNH